MPGALNMSTSTAGLKRRPCGPVRQLSLQTPPAPPTAATYLQVGPARRCQLRKQSSEDISWGSAGGSRSSPTVSRTRPPVRMAWTEQRRMQPEATSDTPKVEVEVVARKCALPQAARSRTPQAKSSSQQQELDGSRLRLAERLRLAWQQSTNTEAVQSRARTNLDIFLAHNNVGSAPASRQADEVITTSEHNYSTVFGSQNYIGGGEEEQQHQEKEASHEKETDEELMRSRSFESRTEEGRYKNEDGNKNEETKMMSNKEKEMKEGKSICISITEGIDDEVGRRRCSASELEDDDEEDVGERVVQQRLKSSRSKNVVRGVSSLTSSPDLVVNKKVDAYSGAGSASRSSTPGGQPLPRRLMSAPPQKRPQSQQDKSSPQISQQARRKLKSGRRKPQKPEEEDISSGDDNIEQKPRRSRSARTSEVITMVSLLSPGQSEQEEDECVTMVISGATDQQSPWQPEHGGATSPATSHVTATCSPFLNAGASVNPILCIRKPVKTVSFQQQSGARSYANNFPSRRGAAILPPETHNPAPPVLRSTSLVAATGGAAKGGADVGAASLKRKLVRATSSNEGTSMQPMMSNEENKPSCTTNNSTQPIEIVLTPATNKIKDSRMDLEAKEQDKRENGCDKSGEEKEEEEEEAENDVPEFKTPKEQECWDLFRRMVDKGITVSFETVLRGMLTPTEYRLRRHNLLTS